jgi:hypothetical protein
MGKERAANRRTEECRKERGATLISQTPRAIAEDEEIEGLIVVLPLSGHEK